MLYVIGHIIVVGRSYTDATALIWMQRFTLLALNPKVPFMFLYSHTQFFLSPSFYPFSGGLPAILPPPLPLPPPPPLPPHDHFPQGIPVMISFLDALGICWACESVVAAIRPSHPITPGCGADTKGCEELLSQWNTSHPALWSNLHTTEEHRVLLVESPTLRKYSSPLLRYLAMNMLNL